jgi:phenylacetate-CoA ligase
MRYVPNSVRSLYHILPARFRSGPSTLYGLLKNWNERTAQFRQYQRELEESQGWSRSRLQELQSERLRSLIGHAATHVPYYRRVFAEHGLSPSQIQTPADLVRLPTVSKGTVREHWRSMLAEGVRPSSLLRETTSGTSGSPLTVYLSKEAYLRAKAAQWLHHAAGGYTHHEWIGILAGYEVVPPAVTHPPFWVVNNAGKQVHFSSFHLRERNVPQYLAEMRARRLHFLLGYPSTIGLLAHFCVSRGEHLPLESVFLSSEPAFEWQLEAIRKAFGCRVFNYYGQTEQVTTAASCRDYSSLHLHSELTVAEFLPDPSLSGHRFLVGTSLVNYAMPLIRYELGDVTAAIEGPCPCGREHERIRPVVTIANDFLVLPDGGLVPALLLHHPFVLARSVAAAQIVQEDPRSVIVQVVPCPGFSPAEAMMIIQGITAIVGPGVAIHLREVPDIPRTKNGKVRFLVSHVSHSISGSALS